VSGGESWKAMGAEQPRLCEICGRRILLASVDALWFSTFPVPQSFHFRCKCHEGKRAGESAALPR
jgi:hypothetical protein